MNYVEVEEIIRDIYDDLACLECSLGNDVSYNFFLSEIFNSVQLLQNL